MSHQYSKSLQVLVWGGLLAVIAAIGLVYMLSVVKRNQVAKAPALPVIGPIGSFTLTNQNGQAVTERNFSNQVLIANIIFTRCPGPCAQMTRRMGEIQQLLLREPNIHLISLTTDPLYDTPEILQRYAKAAGTRDERWTFLTGPVPEIKKLAVHGLKMITLEKAEEDRENPNDLFIHSESFMVVDRKGNLRGKFELREHSAQQVVEGAKKLLREK